MKMRNRKKLKSIATLSLVAAIGLTGCTKEPVNQKDEPVSSQETSAEPEASTQTQNKAHIENLTYTDYSSFTKLQDIKLPYEFQSSFDSGHWDDDYKITGTYDLNQDGKEDNISFDCNRETMETELTINDAKIKETLASPETAYLVDLDTRDSYLNVILFDCGMSDDPNYHLYQYDGTQITKLGVVGSYFEDAIAFDGYNRAVRLDTFLNKLEPALIKGYYEQENNEWNYNEFDLTELTEKEFTVANDVSDAYFRETDDSIEEFDSTWAEEERMTLHVGDKITINKIGEFEKYQVKLADGKEGILYFWIGD